MGKTLATMITLTTYGTWLRGDARGWVDKGIIRPPDPEFEVADRKRMKHPPFRFVLEDVLQTGQFIGDSLRSRLDQRVYALNVQTWHVHLVIGSTRVDLADVVKCAKDAVRWGLRPNRPIWTDGYDKRYCFDIPSVQNRVHYVERHNVELGLPARPWPFIEPFSPP